ncbi:MAG: glycosyl hydrolase, partial [Candidatus Obscuribacterales bacterium]|nr:glycosyl hydrolase [Steroidobacteraceae bacterium]
KTGHLGPTMYRSVDGGHNWKEVAQPPAFRKAAEGEPSRAVDSVFWLTPGHRKDKGVWYAGTSPAGLFRSEDGGDHWESVAGFNDHPMRPQWATGSATPGGELLHSIIVDPRDSQHLYLGISIGGIFESIDGGKGWQPLNEGVEADFLPDQNVPFGQDPHLVVQHPLQPDRLYHQNHCGIYRLDRPSRRWQRIGKEMPKEIGDIGFPIVAHPIDPNTVWVFPMDGTTVWPRTAIGGKPAVYVTRDAGESWQRLDKGLPSSQAWFTVYRQAMCVDTAASPAVYFGTTSGEIWRGANGGESWQCIARHLPHIFAVTHAD